MVIEESDFKMTRSSGIFWDLELLYTVKPKDKPERQEFKDSGYGLTLEHCIKRIILHRLENNKEIYSLETFLDNYRKEVNKINNICNIKDNL